MGWEEPHGHVMVEGTNEGLGFSGSKWDLELSSWKELAEPWGPPSCCWGVEAWAGPVAADLGQT